MIRLIGIIETAASRMASDLSTVAPSRVSVSPGATALTLIFRCAYVAAADLTIASMPPLAAAIASWLTNPRLPATLEVKTSLPPPLRSIDLLIIERERNALTRFV